jgi:hypothetical protein
MTRRGRRAVVAAAAIVSLVPLSFALTLFANSLFIARQSGGGASGRARPSDVPLAITVFGRSDDTISARVGFSNADGLPVSTLERSWAGWELTFDFIVVRSGDGWLAFPYGVATDATGPGGGVDLVKYYDDGGFPAIFESSSIDDAARKALRRMFSIIKTERWVPRFLGSLHHERLTVRSFEAGIPYAVRVSSGGKPYLVR